MVAGSLPSSERLEFRRWRRGDDALAATLWGDADVMRFLGGAYDAQRIAARLESEVANEERYGVQYWPIFVRAMGDFAGCCGLKPHEPARGFFEIGFHLRRDYRGAGYAREAANAVIRFAFDDLRAAALFAGHHPDNEPSHHLLGTLGFVQIGTHFYPPTGLQHPWYLLTPES